jgi:hypothetical protein
MAYHFYQALRHVHHPEASLFPGSSEKELLLR